MWLFVGDIAMDNKKRIWDLAIRLFHWSLVFFFTVAYLTGDDAESLHAYSGYIIIGLLVFRLLWGFIGTRTARFSSFIYSPAETLRYAKAFVSRHPIHYVGHNPLAALMVFALLFSIAFTCWSGLEAYAAEGKGPLAGNKTLLIPGAMADDDEHERSRRHGGSELWEDLHEAAANLTLFLVFIHIAGVLLASVVHGENLIKSMITGKSESIEDIKDSL